MKKGIILTIMCLMGHFAHADGTEPPKSFLDLKVTLSYSTTSMAYPYSVGYFANQAKTTPGAKVSWKKVGEGQWVLRSDKEDGMTGKAGYVSTMFAQQGDKAAVTRMVSDDFEMPTSTIYQVLTSVVPQEKSNEAATSKKVAPKASAYIPPHDFLQLPMYVDGTSLKRNHKKAPSTGITLNQFSEFLKTQGTTNWKHEDGDTAIIFKLTSGQQYTFWLKREKHDITPVGSFGAPVDVCVVQSESESDPSPESKYLDLYVGAIKSYSARGVAAKGK